MAKMFITTMFSGVGSYFGGPLGGMIGGVIGGIVGQLLFPDPPTQLGPRITDHNVVTTAFGEVIRDGWGTMAYPGHLIDGSRLKEKKKKNKAEGKGFMSGPGTFSYVYSVDAAYLFRRREAGGFLRVWIDTKLIRDVGPNTDIGATIVSNYGWKGGTFRFYNGDEDQLPDARLEQIHGVGMVPAYRGMVYLVAYDLQLADFANRVPTISAEIYDVGETAILEYDDIILDLPPPPETPVDFSGAWSHVSDQGEIVIYHQGAGFDSLYYNPLNRVYRITPTDLFDELKLPFSDLLAGGTKLVFGVCDVEGFCLDSTHSDKWYFFNYATGEVRQFYKPGSGSWNGIFLFAGDSFYKYSSGLTNPRLIASYPNGLEYPALSGVIGAYDITGWSNTTDFIYGIVTTGVGVNPHDIYKIDRASLQVVATYTPEIPDFATLVQVPEGGISAKSDEELYISTVSANEGPVRFYLYNTVTNITLLLGEAEITESLVPNYGITTIYKNGVFYWGQQASVSGRHDIHRFIIQGHGNDSLLSTMVRDCCRFAGLKDSRFDVSELTDILPGYARDAQTSPADMIRATMPAYLFDACESDGKIKFKKRGRAISYSIPRGDLAAHEQGQEMPEKSPVKQVQERQLPVTLRVTYFQKDHDYEKGMQYSERLISDFRNVVEVACPISMTDTMARQIAGRLMPIAHAERNSREIVLSRKYVRLEVGDAFEVTI